MQPVIDLTKEYGIVLEGGGARGAYQIGAWKALQEAGLKIKGIAGTSVGALNGAMMCMGDLENAQKVWGNISYSRIMDVDDEKMHQLFDGELGWMEALKEGFTSLKEGGVDVTPLRELIGESIDTDAILNSPIEFYILTFSVDEMKELDIDIKQQPKELIADFLLASAYIFPIFKREKLHGKTYIDGGTLDNVPLDSLVKRDYKDIIMIRIFGIGRERRVKIPEDTTVISIEPRVDLGNIIDFDPQKSRRNIQIGYYDAIRVIYGLKGTIYYIDESHGDSHYLNQLTDLDEVIFKYLQQVYALGKEQESPVRILTERILPAIAQELKLKKNWSYCQLYLAMLEATAKMCRIPKYRIYSVEELEELVHEHMFRLRGEKLPPFVQIVSKHVLI